MDAQLPFDGPQRHALAPGFLDRLPSLPLKEGRLALRKHLHLESNKHYLGSKARVRSTVGPDSAGWTAAFELYSRTFPERELPWIDNWTGGSGITLNGFG